MIWKIIGGRDTQTQLAGKKIELYTLSVGGDKKTLQFSLAICQAVVDPVGLRGPWPPVKISHKKDGHQR